MILLTAASVLVAAANAQRAAMTQTAGEAQRAA